MVMVSVIRSNAANLNLREPCACDDLHDLRACLHVDIGEQSLRLITGPGIR